MMTDYKDHAPLTYIVVPAYRASENLDKLVDSVKEQTDDLWRMVIAVDSCPETYSKAIDIALTDKRITAIMPEEHNRQFALKNIVNAIDFIKEIDKYWGRSVVTIIDGDDQLCNPNALELVTHYYDMGFDIVWTAHRWDIDDRNISAALPEDVDPYKYPWVSSHLRSFGLWKFDEVPESNYKDHNGEFFKRCYDQVLMLPMLYRCNKMDGRTAYIPEVCYQYNINSVSMKPEERVDGSYQTDIARYIRLRGYLSK